MTAIVLNFASLAALAAAIPYLEKTPGLVASLGNGGSRADSDANTSRIVAVVEQPAPAAQDAKADSFDLGSTSPSYTFEDVSKALAAYQKADKAAFGSAMSKFGFKSPKDIEAAPEKWDELMSYIGGDANEAAPTYTAEFVEAELKKFAQKDQKTFGSVMGKFGFRSMKDVLAASDKWPELMKAIG